VASSDTEVVVVGGGAAGIAACRRLKDADIDCLLIEARARLGGRAWTIGDDPRSPIDLGCGWLHSADRNPWRKIAEAQGRSIDKTPPPWARSSAPIGFPLADQAAYLDAREKFYARVVAMAEAEQDAPAATLLDPNGRWNDLIGATGTYVSGAELERVSVRDLGRYDDSGVNWRVVEGYGTVIAAHGAGLPVALGRPVRRIDWSGRRLRVETADGSIAADAAIVTLPSALLAEEKVVFTPGLPSKTEAAAGLPLGLADKLFLSLSDAGEFEKDSRLFGRTDRRGTATYHVRPFGRPQIEAYFAATLAAELETAGEDAFLDFAVAELVGLLGGDFARRIKPLDLHRWGIDPLARGSYSYALPGKADCRTVLAAPVDDRLFFAGEACSTNDYSTAHGAYLTGVAAADQAIAARRGKRSR
jgi:monoamine oxidase